MRIDISPRRAGWIAAAVLGAGLVSVGIATAGLVPPQGVRQVDFGTWAYSAWREDDGSVSARVRYDFASAPALLAYAEANRAAIASLAPHAGNATIQITFRRPVTVADFRTLASGLGAAVESADLRTVSARNEPSMLAVFPRSADPLPQDQVNRQLAAAEKIAGPLTITGVISARLVLGQAKLRTVASDPRVLIPDITPTLVQRDLAAAGVARAEAVSILVPPAFWTMELLGLDKF